MRDGGRWVDGVLVGVGVGLGVRWCSRQFFFDLI